MKKIIVYALLFSFVIPTVVLARVGVGVGTSKIVLDVPLNAGSIYQTSPTVVLNTGDETANYEMSVTFHNDYKNNWPEVDWFKFSPNKFTLEPGKSQIVNIELSLPLKAVPKDYYAFVEARPVSNVERTGGGTSIGIAAATKFEFSIKPSNIFEAIYYRVLSLYNNSKPWSHVIVAVIVLAILITIFRKNFNFQLNIGRKK